MSFYREYIIVTGGRDFADRIALWSALDTIKAWAPDGACVIVQGGHRGGADALARAWAMDREVEFETFPARWKTEGRKAGPLRNQRMVDAICARKSPVIGLACLGGAGTADCVARMKAAGIAISPLRDPLADFVREDRA